MGGLVSRLFRRKFEATDYAQILETLEADLLACKERKSGFVGRHRSAVSRLLIFFLLLEIGLGVWYYFHTKPTDLPTHLLHILPLVLVPIVCFLLKRAVTGFYNWRIQYTDERIQEILDQQRQKVHELKQITNFEIISRLIARFDPDAHITSPNRQQPQQTPARRPPQQTPQTQRSQQPPSSQIRQPQQPPSSQVRQPQQPQPQPPQTPFVPPTPGPQQPQQPQHPQQPAPTPFRPPQTPMPATGGVPQTPSVGTAGKSSNNNDTGLRHRSTQGAGRSYVMAVPRQNNPVPSPVPARYDPSVKKGLFDRAVDWIVGDGPAYSSPVHCAECNALHSYLPKGEVAPQFTCPVCGVFNDSNMKGRSKSSNTTASTTNTEKKQPKDSKSSADKEKQQQQQPNSDDEKEREKEAEGEKDASLEEPSPRGSEDDDAFLGGGGTTNTNTTTTKRQPTADNNTNNNSNNSTEPADSDNEDADDDDDDNDSGSGSVQLNRRSSTST
eukprot:TRINITY_DN2777_c0_g1_i1.p1 TRINITY_DN2777_c0_g1~~TRINITY_DN2777_c0_g1_i1.p1  ORF type:complete len:497 (+),score=162.84 TRINITY_DN2777_c0_g1_i1:68-1558(+)